MAERLYEGNIWGIADELSVTTNIINDYQTMLHERNRVHA